MRSMATYMGVIKGGQDAILMQVAIAPFLVRADITSDPQAITLSKAQTTLNILNCMECIWVLFTNSLQCQQPRVRSLLSLKQPEDPPPQQNQHTRQRDRQRERERERERGRQRERGRARERERERERGRQRERGRARERERERERETDRGTSSKGPPSSHSKNAGRTGFTVFPVVHSECMRPALQENV